MPSLSLLEQFRVIAGASEHTISFEFVRDGVRIRVADQPGTASVLELYTLAPGDVSPAWGSLGPGAHPAYRSAGQGKWLVVPRPLAIELRRETAANRRYKARGVDREVQIGVADFDHAVYIDSPNEARFVRPVFAAAEVRAAAMALLDDGCQTVTIDDKYGYIKATIVEFPRVEHDQTRAARLATSLARLASALPPLRSAGPAPRDRLGFWTQVCGLATIGGAMAACGVYRAATPDRCYNRENALECAAGPECCLPLRSGTIAGAGLGVVAALVLSLVTRGRSNTSRHLRWLQLAAAVLLIELSIAVARLLT